MDEKSQIQALDRTASTLPMQPGRAASWTHDYRRHGTTTLFAALEIATGKVTAACKPRHRHQEFLAFCEQVARTYPTGELHLVMDNYAAHKRVEIRDWLAANPRVHVHFTPTSASWMTLVEVWFGIIEQRESHGFAEPCASQRPSSSDPFTLKPAQPSSDGTSVEVRHHRPTPNATPMPISHPERGT